MRNLFLLLIALSAAFTAFANQGVPDIMIIPEPVSVVKSEGKYQLPERVVIAVPLGDEIKIVGETLKDRLTTAANVSVEVGNVLSGADIVLAINAQKDNKIGDEGYNLSVSTDKIVIRANQPAGLYYGVQTLLQLFPAEIESKTYVADVDWSVPAVEIEDYPRMGWRGLMFDVSRHFFTVDEVKQFIDNMVKYKYNMLHWHLTDDEGWRIEIKSLPKLTEVGAWRVDKTGTFNYFSDPLPDEPKNYGGFYTHEDIREVVRYAAERFVDVMPEIDVPGHSLAAIASYPELSCTEDAVNYNVRAGEPIMDWSTHPPTGLIDDTLCPANEKVYEFLDKVMTEVAELFPFEYIHTGGDEAPFNFWEKSSEVDALMKREGLKNYAEVQSYFGKRLEKIVQAKGKKMMGWDEILEGGITPTTALMSWRGIEYGIEASKSGHYVVMTPMQYVYIDLLQGDLSTEPPVYSTVRLNQSYKYDPVPEGADEKYILGGQANLWTEQVYNIRQAEYMVWPRGFAVAESLWSPKESKDWNRFVSKTESHFERFDQAQTKYSPAMYDPIVKVSRDGDQYFVSLTTEIEGLDIHTSFDNSTPDNFYPKYSKPKLIPKDASLMRIITYRDGKPTGRLMSIPVDDLKKRVRN